MVVLADILYCFKEMIYSTLIELSFLLFGVRILFSLCIELVDIGSRWGVLA